MRIPSAQQALVAELTAALRDLALGAEMMLQPIPLLAANKPLVRYAEEVKRVARAAIDRAEAEHNAPHSWATEDYTPERVTVDKPDIPATEFESERCGAAVFL